MILNMKSILEADESLKDEKAVSSDVINDETGANLDNTLSGADLMSIMDDICPITGDVYASMKNAAKDPKNLKVTAIKSGDGEDAKLFIEAYEFNNFCEANSITEGEGADLIIDTYKEEVPELDNAEFHVVFPEDSFNKNDWAMKLMGGCRRYGLKVNTSIKKSNESLNESLFGPKMVKHEFTSSECQTIISKAKSLLNDSKFKEFKGCTTIYSQAQQSQFIDGILIGSVSISNLPSSYKCKADEAFNKLDRDKKDFAKDLKEALNDINISSISVEDEIRVFPGKEEKKK